MRKTVLIVLALAAAVPVAAAGRQPAVPALPAAAREALAAALADPHRTGADRLRDRWRHPAETLAFCRIAPGMSVVEVMPGGGWWTRIMPFYLGGQGRYVAVNPDVTRAPEPLRASLGGTAERFPSRAAEWTGLPAERLAAWNSDGLPVTMNGTIDRVMVMREVHNLHRWGMLYAELNTVRRLLKPDGLVCIEEHRAKATASADYANGAKGYMRQQDVIALMQASGFDLVSASEINANPKDSADWPDGVWTLPPTFAKKDVDRARYEAVGESDRMTLLFRKRP